jgi:putative membrane protein
MRNKRNYPLLIIKGCAMGAADVIPGVSGGTIAFISGIYEELLHSIKSIDLQAVKLLFTLRLREFWKKINGNFLFSVVLGIAISIFSLAKLMSYLLIHQPIGTWAFFFGLIIASSILVSRDVSKWNIATVISLLAGVTAAYFITVTTPASTPDTWWFIMLCGAVAICAMILPGISGAFILLLMGKYRFLMDAVGRLDIPILLIFLVGAIIGIISFSHLLSWLLKHKRDLTIALLTGFMIGSLNKVWPWKEVLDTYEDSAGALHPLVERNIAPGTFESLYGASSQLWQAILLCVAGFMLIAVIELISKRLHKDIM